MNPLPPRFYGLPKLHKENQPVRPIVSGISAPAHKLAYMLNSEIRQITKFHPKYSVANSTELASELGKKSILSNTKKLRSRTNVKIKVKIL
ncbi:hypothetical protein J437_LFUL013185 [Ladona fulva]|uniref:Uncharacterized protein n=1 Tax=Ladona fulva TaxID=123851 RepID=A0A8K0KB01_LADFU|nr:hypothetical protein J437_LFUL013185 [Ladona fulva]